MGSGRGKIVRETYIHIPLCDGMRNLLPRPPTLHVVLLLNSSHIQLCQRMLARVVCVHLLFALGILYGKAGSPLTIHRVNGFLLPALRVERRGEAVLLAREPAFAAVVDLGSETA